MASGIATATGPAAPRPGHGLVCGPSHRVRRPSVAIAARRRLGALDPDRGGADGHDEAEGSGRRNSDEAQKAQSSRPKGAKKAALAGLSTAEKNKLDDKQFAFPKERKEPLVDAKHVRNAVARFDQVEGVTDKERDQAWRRIKAAAKKFGVEIEEKSWRELFSGGKATKKR